MLKKLGLALIASALVACSGNGGLGPNDPYEYIEPENRDIVALAQEGDEQVIGGAAENPWEFMDPDNYSQFAWEDSGVPYLAKPVVEPAPPKK